MQAVAPDDEEPVSRASRGIQSIEVGGRLLVAMADLGRPATLKELAEAAGMSAPKAHAYLVSFGHVGLVEQDAATSRYELGPLALRLGLICLQRLDPVRLALPSAQALAARVGQSVALSVWGNLGPTVVRLIESDQPVHVNMRTGTVMSLSDTATGRAFAAWLAPGRVERALALEARLAGDPASTLPARVRALERSLDEVRRHGLARAVGQPIPGVNALSAPVFDHGGDVTLVITVLGPAESFPPDWDSPVAQALRDMARDLSRRLGHAGRAA